MMRKGSKSSLELSAAIDESNSSAQTPRTSRISSHTVKGLKHLDCGNEDEILIECDLFSEDEATNLQVGLFGVFDGHGGSKCSATISKILPKHFKQSDAWRILDEEAAEESDLVEKVLVRALKYAFQASAEEFDEIAKAANDFSGSCALVAAICNGVVVTANLGDSRAIIYLKDGDKKSARSTARHNISNRDEFNRCIAAGGFFHKERLFGCLLPTRAFGNLDCRSEYPAGILSSIPDFQFMKLKHEVLSVPGNACAMVLASDGLWDFVEVPEVMKILANGLKKQKKQLETVEIAETMVESALKNGSDDDITTIVVVFQ